MRKPRVPLDKRLVDTERRAGAAGSRAKSLGESAVLHGGEAGAALSVCALSTHPKIIKREISCYPPFAKIQYKNS